MTLGSVAVTGSNGRLGRALLDELARRGIVAFPWARPDYNLDVEHAAQPLFDRDQPSLVIHAAAWTNVDGCARDPALAHRRNAAAVEELAASCERRGVRLVVVSTNEVFDGRRTDGRGYIEEDRTNPINAYGRSKLAGEELARAAFADWRGALQVVRTSWLFGPPGNDFPAKIIAAADRLGATEPLRVVSDEFGSPTYTRDLARGLITLAESDAAGTFHITNEGHTSRAGWAAKVLAVAHRTRAIAPISQAEFLRASTPPAWGVLDTAKARAQGIDLRPWEDAVRDYVGGAAAR